MDFPCPSKSPSDMLGNLKDRFGFGNSQNRQDDYDYDYDEYDEFAEYAPEPGEEGYDDYAGEEYVNPYDRLEYTSRPSASARSASRSGRSGRSGDLASHLVSADDIRATTRFTPVGAAAETEPIDVVEEEPAPYQPMEGFDVPKQTYAEFSSPYRGAGRSVGSAGADSASAGRSAGLDSLFTPTDTASASAGTAAPTASAAASTTSANDPYAAYENGAAGTTFASTVAREVTLLKPQSYDDVSSIARSVRAGNIVVLALRTTDSALSKRVLDFSFGVASALNAQVDYVADKTFVILVGGPLTLEERSRLRHLGVL